MIDVCVITEDHPLWSQALACFGSGPPADHDRHVHMVARRIAHHRRFVPSADCLVAALHAGRVIDAALCLEYPGAAATCLLSGRDTGAAGLSDVATRLIQALIQRCRERGVYLIEATEGIDAGQRGRAWADAGFKFITRLLYLEKEVVMSVSANPPSTPGHVRSGAAPATPPIEPSACQRGRDLSLTWVPYVACDPADVAALYAMTCRESLDFPELTPLRSAEQALASHRVSGDTDAQMWWVAKDRYQPVALVLLTLHESLGAVEVAYLGVIPDYRGRGVGAALLFHSEQEAVAVSATRLTLAVDRRNAAGKRLYERWGFRVLAQRDAWLMALSTHADRA